MDKYQVLKQYFGYDQFREGQELLIDNILSGRDTLGIMPTGAGKSLCFQIPALMMEGITLVISPLISLMKDQVTALNQAGVHAAFLNSSLTAAQYHKALSYAKEGRYPIIYVAPERLTTDDFLDFALNAKISMIAIDEAHCVSQWGQDFRPSYLKILDFIHLMPIRPIICAFTATATKEVRDDIIDILMLQEPMVTTTGFDRPNLYFCVMSPKKKYETMMLYLENHRGESGIIYCLTRKLVEEVCNLLRKDGYPATRYHAGLSDAERHRNQDDFIYDRYPVMVATNAFGMGIDKSNVRYVVHYNMPKNIESYYQEAGRAGRDGEPSECILYYSGQDVVTNQFFIDNSQENQGLDPVTRAIVQERDRERLRKMTFYCFTNECLRDYILRYFGDYGENYCGNCSNCLSQFETVDVTAIARGIIGCVESCRQRYGTNVITDTVHGAKTIKIRNYRMDENPHYGELAEIPVYKLRQVMNHLQVKNYLSVTNDEYAIVKLTEKSKDVLEEKEPILMKMAKEQEHVSTEKSVKERKTRKRLSSGLAGTEFTENEERLFEKLRNLRTEIAREEKVPPYIVFSDKTLTHMCVVKPKTKAEMLSVTGVGEFKYEKYGERFLSCVQAELEKLGESSQPSDSVLKAEDLYLANDSEEFDDWIPDDVMSAWENAGTQKPLTEPERQPVEIEEPKKKKSKKTKTDFMMSQELAEQIHYSQRVSLSDFIGQINDLRDEEEMKRLTIKCVEQKLREEGYYEEQVLNGILRKQLTERGAEFGIETEKRISEKGNEYETLFYFEKAQRWIVEWLLTSTI